MHTDPGPRPVPSGSARSLPVDAVATEAHFLDHIAPVWRGLDPELRGTLLLDDRLAGRGEDLGFEPEAIDANALRREIRFPVANPGPGPVAIVASYGDVKVGRRLGYRRFVFIEHGAGQAYTGDRRNGRHGSYAGGEDREDVGLFLVPNVYSATLWRDAYPDADVEIVGSPKVDGLPGRVAGPSPVVAVSFHWEAHVVPEARPAFGHHRTALPELARRFTVIGHGHPRAEDWLRRVYRRVGIPWVPDFEEVCRRADVYVCDNSSTLFEFASTGRPVVVLNAPWYRRRVQHGLRFWDAAGVGRQVDEPEQLVPAVAAAIENPDADKAERDAALSIAYTYRGDATKRAVAAIEEWIRGATLDGTALGEDGSP